MTPLAHRIIKDLALPAKDRTWVDGSRVQAMMGGVHCFDATAVMPLATELARSMYQHGVSRERAFLPSEKTWLEVRDEYGYRQAVFLWSQANDHALCVQVLEDGRFHPFTLPLNEDLGGAKDRRSRQVILDSIGDCPSRLRSDLIYALLAIINTPRLIGRKQHMPHRGLERCLAKAKQTAGIFPLRAWTELTLSVSAMLTEADGTVHEAHYTGEKCLHFCRSHLRVRNGRLEQVKAHWRGNPSLGIKQTRYKLVA